MPLARRAGETRLVLLRHGRTSWNVAGRFQGHADPDLDAVGRAQASRAADQLALSRPVTVVASDLRRARWTAAVVAERCHVGMTADARLREVDVGGWAGLDHAGAAQRFPGEYGSWLAGADVRRGGGETVREAGDRVAEALLDAATRLDVGATVVVVSHGVALQAALAALIARGRIELVGAPPHLDNGAWVAARAG